MPREVASCGVEHQVAGDDASNADSQRHRPAEHVDVHKIASGEQQQVFRNRRADAGENEQQEQRRIAPRAEDVRDGREGSMGGSSALQQAPQQEPADSDPDPLGDARLPVLAPVPSRRERRHRRPHGGHVCQRLNRVRWLRDKRANAGEQTKREQHAAGPHEKLVRTGCPEVGWTERLQGYPPERRTEFC